MAVQLDLKSLPEWRVGGVDVTAVGRETVEQVGDNDLPGLSAEMAYHSTLALFPFLLFLAGLTAVVDAVFGIQNLTDRLVEQLGEIVSSDAHSVAESVVQEVRQSRGASGSSVIGTAMKGLNRIYDLEEDRGMIKRKLVAVGLAMVFCGLLLMAAILVAGGEIIGGAIGDRIGLGDQASSLMGWLMWLLSVLLLVLAVTVLYWLGPAGEKRLRWVTPGAAVFAVGWVLASAIFAFVNYELRVLQQHVREHRRDDHHPGVVVLDEPDAPAGAQVNQIVENVRDNGEVEPQRKTTQAQP
ncbi:MAG TPA: YihY/virulence factor BrkB family protein [Dehalococcoidia bacterium]|nr:YihY/virulence factor BrkB family protein [Dehalococcoidia bacterium]